MYFYYLCAAIGPWMQPYLWWKKYLTTLQVTFIGFLLVFLSRKYKILSQLVQFVMVFFHAMQPLFFQCDFPLAARCLLWIPAFTRKYLFASLVWCSVELHFNTSFFSVPSTKRLTGLFWFFVYMVIFQHWYVGNQSQPPQMAKFQQSRRTTQRKSWNTKIQKRRSILTLKTSWRTWAGQLIRQVNAKLHPIKLNNFIFCKQNQDMKKRAKVRDLCFVVTYENLKWIECWLQVRRDSLKVVELVRWQIFHL